MSIRSEYFLTIQEGGPSTSEVATEITAVEGRYRPDDPSFQHQAEIWKEIIEGSCPANWDDSEHHMRAVSRKWPEVLFKVRSHGMEGQGHSVSYFQNGKAQTDNQPQWGPAEFDPAKLR